MTNASSSCPHCGAPLPDDSPQALCPACLMKQALASRTLVPEGESARFAPPLSPEEIADKFPQFEITQCLGRGGMGVVYKARQKSLDRWVAIKILPPERVGEEKFAERFAREAQTLARLSHPNIVTVFDYGETGGLFYIVMEFVDGVNLRDLLRDGKLVPEQALAIVPPICEALQYAHDKGIVHRDIKPENLLLDRDGRIKIADFGIASLVGAGGESAGTPPYMAPEQSAAPAKVDHRADIYALGVVLYEMLTGERPAPHLVAPSRKTPLDAKLDEVVLRALDQDPERRYQTAEEFRTIVETVGATSPPPPMPASAPPVKKGAFARLWWLFLVLIPIGALLGLGCGAVALRVMPKKYEATTVLQIRPESGPQPVPLSSVPWMESVKSRESLEEVASRLKLDRSWNIPLHETVAVLKSIVDVREIRGTSLLEIRVRYNDRRDVVEIAKTLGQVFRDRMGKNAIGEYAVIVHEEPVEPQKPVSPNPALVLVIPAAAGLVLSPVAAALLILLVSRGWLRGCLILCGVLFLMGAIAVAILWSATPQPSSRTQRPSSLPSARPARLLATLRFIDMPLRDYPKSASDMKPDMQVLAVLRSVIAENSDAEVLIPFIPGRETIGECRLPREGALIIRARLKDGVVTYDLEGFDTTVGRPSKTTSLGRRHVPLGEVSFLDERFAAPGRKQIALLSFEVSESAPHPRPPATGGWRYGPVIERVVFDPGESTTDCLIDLDTGKLGSLPADVSLIQRLNQSPRETLKREIRTTPGGAGMDAIGRVHEGGDFEPKRGLVGGNLLAYRYTWRSKDASRLMDTFDVKDLDPNRSLPKFTGIPFSPDDLTHDVAWMFCTDENRRGLLQVTGLTGDQHGVKIRYKLVETPQVTWDAEPGTRFEVPDVTEEVLLQGGRSPDGAYEVRVRGLPDDTPFSYGLHVYAKDKNEPIYSLPEAGGYMRYSAAKRECSALWHSSGKFVILSDRGSKRSREIYLLSVSGERVERLELPDHVANALGRVNATGSYRACITTPERWEGGDLHLKLGFDTMEGFFTCTVVLELRHGPNQVPRASLKSCSMPQRSDE